MGPNYALFGDTKLTSVGNKLLAYSPKMSVVPKPNPIGDESTLT